MHRLVGTLACVAILVALVPSAAAQNGSGPLERLVVSFEDFPEGLARGDHYLGQPVVAVDETLGFAVVETKDGRAFEHEARGRREVRLVEEDPVRGLLGLTPNDARYAQQYAPAALGLPDAWTTTFGAGDVTICILDTGVRHTHEDLKANYAGGIDLVNGDNDPLDDHGHGTRVAGVAVATINNQVGVAGVANVKFLMVKVLDRDGYARGSAIATGIRWCADQGADVISMSFGGAGNDTATYESVEYAWNKGALLVAGAGNGGCEDCVIYPAALERVVAVGCVDSAKAVCSFTSKGPQVDLAAPGVNVLTTAHTGDASYVQGGGTSISTPHVAGAAALVWSGAPSLTNKGVRDALEHNAQDVGTTGRDMATGHGLVRADLAMRSVLPAAAPTPAPEPAPMSASFKVSPNVGEWWIEVYLSSSSSIGKVEVRINNGTWLALPKTNWGAYAKSIHAPRGSHVVFKATATDGRSVLSDAYQWLGPAGFMATFSPRAQTNVWWIETAVSSSSTVAKVETRVNGGSWIALPKTDWGTWAKSIHAPSGSKVEFRATSSSGQSVTSGVYVWG